MYNRDYVMRMIEQLGKTLGVLLGLKKQQEPEKMAAAIDEAFKRLFGLSGGLLRSLSDRDLISLLSKEGYGENERLLACAALLKEDGDGCRLAERHDEARRRWQKALRLYLHAAGNGAVPQFMDVEAEVDTLLGLLPITVLPYDTRYELWGWLEQKGRFAEAENLLFAMLEVTNDRTVLASEGLRFYERLLALPEEALDTGGLPRDEILDAVRELREMLNEGGGRLLENQ